jgi:hypothetical protein
MKTGTETKRAELYVSECCLFETTITKNQTITRCLMNVSGQKPTWFHRILRRFLALPSVCRCECHHHSNRANLTGFSDSRAF